MTTITLNKGGTAEKTIDLSGHNIPDLWHIAMWLQEESKTQDNKALAISADKILETWHLAHDLKRHILEEAAQ